MNDKDWQLFKKSVSPLKGKKKMFAMSKSTLTQSKVDKKEVNLELMDISASEDLLEAAAVPSLFLILIAAFFITITSKHILKEKDD